MNVEAEGTATLQVVAGRDERDWEAVYRAHVGPIHAFLHSRLGNRADAEDLTAQTFLRALPHLEVAAPADDVRGYLFRVARALIADHWAARFRIPTTCLLDRDQEPAPSPPAGSRSRADRQVGIILGRLSDRHRAVLELRFLRGYSIRETATALGISTANAKVTQWRALRHAAALFEELP